MSKTEADKKESEKSRDRSKEREKKEDRKDRKRVSMRSPVAAMGGYNKTG